MLLSWLNDAYAMEQAAEDLANKDAVDINNYPEAQKKFREFSQNSSTKKDALEELIESLGSEVSTAKNIFGKVSSTVQSATSELMHDQVVKHILVTYSAVHLGIASYTSLAAAATDIGMESVRAFAELSVQEKRKDATWLEGCIPTITKEFLEKEHEG